MDKEPEKISEVRLIISGIVFISYLFLVGESASALSQFSVLKIEIVHSHVHEHGHGHDHHSHSTERHQDHETPEHSPHSHELSLNVQFQAIVASEVTVNLPDLSRERLNVDDFKAPVSPDRAPLFRPPIV